MNNVGKRWYNEELWTNASIVTKMLIGTATLNFTSKSLGIHQIRNTSYVLSYRSVLHLICFAHKTKRPFWRRFASQG